MAGVTAAFSFAAAAALGRLSGRRAKPASVPEPDAEPSNAGATPEARSLLRRIQAISGRFILTGQQNFPEDLARCSDHVQELTCRFPAIFGQEFGHVDFDGRRARMIAEAERQHHLGAVVALTWHAPRPIESGSASYEETVLRKLTDEQWAALLTPGSDIFQRWGAQVDEIAEYLKQLQAAQIPVLFRPYHEMNARWFWWGGRPGTHGSAALYRQLYKRYVQVHQLNNLVWVWNVNAPGVRVGPIAPYYPGSEYVDIVSMDNYRRFRRRHHDQMLALAGNKPIALAEVGRLPKLQVLRRQPRWAYFMIWRGFEEDANSPEHLRTVFHAPNALNRGDERFVAPPVTDSPAVESK